MSHVSVCVCVHVHCSVNYLADLFHFVDACVWKLKLIYFISPCRKGYFKPKTINYQSVSSLSCPLSRLSPPPLHPLTLSLYPILIQESFWCWQCSDRYIISHFPHLHTPFPPFSPSLISLMASVDVKHHVYSFELSVTNLLSYCH